MKAIGIDFASKRFSRKVIVLCALLCAAAALLVLGVVARQSDKDGEFNAACRSEAIKWNSQLIKHKSHIHDPAVVENLAMDLARARIACPKGHSLIDDRRIPVTVLERSNDGRVVEVVKSRLEKTGNALVVQ